MNKKSVFVVYNDLNYLLGVYGTQSEAEFKADVFTRNNREAGDKNSQHRVAQYDFKRQSSGD